MQDIGRMHGLRVFTNEHWQPPARGAANDSRKAHPMEASIPPLLRLLTLDGIAPGNLDRNLGRGLSAAADRIGRHHGLSRPRRSRPFFEPRI